MTFYDWLGVLVFLLACGGAFAIGAVLGTLLYGKGGR